MVYCKANGSQIMYSGYVMHYSYLGLFFNCNVTWEYLLVIPDDVYSLLIRIYCLELLRRCNTKPNDSEKEMQNKGMGRGCFLIFSLR